MYNMHSIWNSADTLFITKYIIYTIQYIKIYTQYTKHSIYYIVYSTV